MYTVSYQDGNKRHWNDAHVFNNYKELTTYLHAKGFVKSDGVFVRRGHGWCMGLRAYPERMKVYGVK